MTPWPLRPLLRKSIFDPFLRWVTFFWRPLETRRVVAGGQDGLYWVAGGPSLTPEPLRRLLRQSIIRHVGGGGYLLSGPVTPHPYIWNNDI